MFSNSARITAKVTYEIVYQDEIRNDPKCMGLCDPNKHIIYIKTGQSATAHFKTMLHELMHCIAIENDIEIPHESIYKLEDALFKFIKFNKLIK